MNTKQIWQMFIGLLVRQKHQSKPIERLKISRIVFFEWPCEICNQPIVNRDVVMFSELFDNKNKYVGRNEYVHASCAVLIRKEDGIVVRPNGQIIPVDQNGGVLEKVHQRTVLLTEAEWIKSSGC